jgi:hypothetical protein
MHPVIDQEPVTTGAVAARVVVAAPADGTDLTADEPADVSSSVEHAVSRV